MKLSNAMNDEIQTGLFMPQDKYIRIAHYAWVIPVELTG